MKQMNDRLTSVARNMPTKEEIQRLGQSFSRLDVELTEKM